MKKIKILVIEDEQTHLKILEHKFIRAGFEVAVALDGKTGLDLANKFYPDVILLDIILPALSGMDVLKRLKKEKRTKNIPVIVLSNLGENSYIKKALAQGAENYLIKTRTSLAEVRDRVKSVLKK